uniref:Uncharacterized protein n=1 Tax=Neogobius melanostomus TaxID=47308 RepID=A0A8C6V118_9GOBI
MGTTASAEPCVYERLWESIAVLRESGHRYGMSERDIERFITQVLQTNEPQPHDEPPEQEPEQDGLPHAFPLLRATAKCALALCLLLVLGLGLASPQSHSGSLSLDFNWSCPLGAARLLDLPIAHKYNLQGYRGWWGSGLPGQKSTVNSSVCAEEPRLVVVKGGDGWRLRRPDLEQLFQAHPDSVSVRADHGLCTALPQGPANFSMHWRPATGGAAEQLLFPAAQRPLLDRAGTALRRCVVSTLRHSPAHLQSHSVPVQGRLVLSAGRALLSVSALCPGNGTSHHRTSRLQLGPGDNVFIDPQFWRTELFLGPDQTIFCDGSSP